MMGGYERRTHDFSETPSYFVSTFFFGLTISESYWVILERTVLRFVDFLLLLSSSLFTSFPSLFFSLFLSIFSLSLSLFLSLPPSPSLIPSPLPSPGTSAAARTSRP